MKDENFKKKHRNSFLKALQANKDLINQNKLEMTTSSLHTKLELPILYSNLITIEDMKYENSKYYIRSNGFLNSNLKLSSEKYDNNFSFSDCVFRIFPKTYNINKYKVLDYIQTKTELKEGNEEEMNFKYESELFNNLDIVESKFGEPVRYGDIIMLMHEKSQKLIKYNPNLKKLVLSNHDSEFTLFSVEPHCEIMLNDDQVLKSGQPIKLKVASFIYADQNLYFSLHFPYEDLIQENKIHTKNLENLNVQGGFLSELNHSIDNSVTSGSFDSDDIKKDVYDKISGKYIKSPELIIEEDSNMRWRFNLYSTFTIDENLLVYGDFINILHCDSNACLNVEQIQIIQSTLQNSQNVTVTDNKTISQYLNLNESEISNNPIMNNLGDSITDAEHEEFFNMNYSINSKFFLKRSNISDMINDVNSTWIIENIFPKIKNVCFVRFYDSTKLDIYRMTFRLKNFKTGKYLSICKIENPDENMKNCLGYLQGMNDNYLYKFGLVDDNKTDEEDYQLSEEYQYSLFAFHPNNSFNKNNRAEKNQFLKIFHVSTKSYLKVLYLEDNKNSQEDNLNMLKCVLTLTQHEEDHEVFKINTLDPTCIWNFRFLHNMYYLFKSIIIHMNESITQNKKKEKTVHKDFLLEEKLNNYSSLILTPENTFSKVKYKILKTTNFVLEKLHKFITNQFINKFSQNYDYKSVVYERQNLISKFGFTNLIMRDFIYDFWIDHKNMSNLKELTKIIRKLNSLGEEQFSNLSRKEKVIYKMYKYTDSLFQFLILYCKDNQEIKDELYEHLDIFFYFINLKESCVYCLIEIFKENSKVLHSLVRDCKTNPKFRKALVNIYKTFFVKRLDAEDEILKKQLERSSIINHNNLKFFEENKQDKSEFIKDSNIDEDLNLIDLIFEYVKISKYEKNPNFNNDKLLHKYISETSAISLISRDKYFELLKSLVYIHNGNNILENQRIIIEKIFINSKLEEDDFTLVNFLQKNKYQIDYPPCLSELLVSVADQNSDPNVLKFLKINFNLERLFSFKNENQNIINNMIQISDSDFDKEYLAVNLKLISNFISQFHHNNKSEDFKSFSEKILHFYEKVIKYLDNFFDNDNKINYADKSEVNSLISIIQFIKTVYVNDITFHKVNKHEKKLISNLMYFITNSYYSINQNKKSSHNLQEAMNKKQLTITERIVKSEHSNYLSIAKSWLNVYLVFKSKLSKLVEEESHNKSALQIINKFKSINNISIKHSLSNKLIKISKKDTRRSSKNLKKEKLKSLLHFSLNKSDLDEEKNNQNLNKNKTQFDKNYLNNKTEFIPKFNEHRDNVISLFQDKKKMNVKDLNFYTIDELDENKKRENEEMKYKEDWVEDKYRINSENSMNVKSPIKSIQSQKSVFLNEDYVERMKSKILYQKGMTQAKSLLMDQEFHTENENFKEDERKRNKNEVMKNILKLLGLFIKKNIQIMIDNFFNFYNLNNNITDDKFTNFLDECIFSIESADINFYIKNYSEIENNLNKKTFWTQNITDLNILFESKHDKSLNFIQNLMISFNITDELEIQEDILNLIYKFSSQRRKFFKRMMMFNEHLISVQNKEKSLLHSNDKNSIKSNFIKFFSNYEKNKFRFTNKNMKESLNYFSNLQLEISFIFKKILLSIKSELKNLNSENIKKIYENKDENDLLIEELDNYLKIMNEIEKDAYEHNKSYTEIFEEIIKLFYFIRNNLSNSIIGSVAMILNQNQNIFNQLNFSIFRDFLDKGNRLILHFKNYQNISLNHFDDENIILIREKYFYCFSLLIILVLISIPRNKKCIEFLIKILQNNKELLTYDVSTQFIILLSLSDLQKENFNLNYYLIMENMKQFNNFNTNFDLMSFGVTNLYLDIMKNILKYIIDKDKIIAESNLDEIIVENLIFLLNKLNLDFHKSGEIIKLLQVIHIILKVESLSKILRIKMENFEEIGINNILDKFPKPDEILELFKINILRGIGNENNNSLLNLDFDMINNTSKGNLISSYKNAYIIFKYILLYLTEVNLKYFDKDKYLNPKKEMVRELFLCVFYGYSYFTEEKKNHLESESFINGINFENSPEKYFYEILVNSDFFVILNVFSINFIKFGDKNLNFLKITDLSFANLTKVITDFVFKIESKEIVITFSQTFTMNKKTIQTLSIAETKISEQFYCFYFIIQKLQKFLKKSDIFKNFLIIIKEKKKLIQNEIREIKLMKKYKCLKFKEMIWHNRKQVIELGNSEAQCLVYNFLNLLNKDKNHENILYTFISKVIEFIYKSTMYKCSNRIVKINNFFNFVFKELILFFDDKSKVELNFLKKKSLKEIQLLFERTGIVKNGLKIISIYTNSEVVDQYPFIFDNFCMLLMKGNEMWQEIIYKNFTTNNEFELVFKFIHNLISEKMDSIVTNKSNIIRNKKKKIQAENFKLKFFNEDSLNKLDSRVLQFLQLLCENHNRKLQLFLHHQENFRKSYDLVSLTNVYLQVLYIHFDKHLFDPLLKCFDLLIEFIQGPCIQNQHAMINSKLMITISDILNTYLHIDEIGKKYITYNSNESKDFLYKMNPIQISLLVYKCSILLLALVEARRKEDKIYDQIMLNVKPELINAVYDKIYFQHLIYLENSNDEGYFIIRIRDLNRAEELYDNLKDNPKDSRHFSEFKVNEYLIIESGFNLFFLLQYMNEYKMTNLKENVEIQKNIIKDDRNIISLFLVFLLDLLISITKFLSLLISAFVYIFTFGKKKIFNLVTKLFKRRNYRKEDSNSFFLNYTKSIEILRDEIVYKIYFFYYPFLRSFKNFEKNAFLEGMDRTNSKTKLMDILRISNKLKFELEYDYKVKRFLDNIPTIGVIFKHIELWKDMSLLLTLVQNFFNIAAYFKKEIMRKVCLDGDDCYTQIDWEDDKSYFNLDGEEFKNIVNKMAIVQTCLAGIIVLEFFSRKTLSIIKEIGEELNNFNFSTIKRKFIFFKLFVIRTFLNFEVIYYICYITAALLGYLTVDFWFAFLLLEVVTRFKTLKNVVMAIRNPIKELSLTFILWIILIYYFAVIAYSFFREDFKNDLDCQTLLRCLATIFYQNNRNDNGIATHLKPILVGKDNSNPLVARFWYDQFFNLIVKILIIQMVAGIIIDNFAKLRMEEMNMIADMNNVCTICGLKKEDIEKVYDKYGRTYQDHINADHNIFNYIYFIIYLHKKDKTEFTGMESFVYDMVFNQKDITWFPINK